VAAVREGRPATDALRALLLDRFEVRSAYPPALDGMWDSAPVAQRYACPRSVCSPRSRGENAAEPWCHLDDQPLRPTTYRPGA
jgi:hypothetical protein